MACVVAIVAPGEMGSAVGARLAEHGVRVTTSLAGRSGTSAARAERAGLIAIADDDALVGEADFVLSIVPPGEAVGLAQRFAPALQRSSRKPIYVDCNAVSPQTAQRIGAVLQRTGCAFVDAGIIGPPPPPNATATRIYVSGEAAPEVARLSEFGLAIRLMEGPIGTASGLKMSYAGITKGLTALGAAMILGAARAGCADALHREMSESLPQLLGWLTRQVPRMYPKAYRWVAEMEEIGHFLGDETPGGDMFAAVARLYQDLAVAARDPDAPDGLLAPLTGFYETGSTGTPRRPA